ncbi:MAG TPA: hypothetical protein VGY58_22895, partial [Gemmataceae bacterium]|jgi:hypothetical protein|nr:hypothetical protein [Gemmataceae bacterium]
MYVNLATSTLFLGSLGLLQPVEPAPGKTSTSAGLGALGLVFSVQALIGARWLMSRNWSAALVGLVAPISPFLGIFDGDPWLHNFAFFGYSVPLLLATPIMQLLLAWLCVQTTVRKLINPLDPPYSKRTAYIALLIFDVLAGAVLFEPPPAGMPLAQRCAAFCLAHLLVSLVLINNVTPWRESLHSWIWRLRGPVARLRDLWLGARSETGLALITFCIIGAVGVALLVVVPQGLDQGFTEWRAHPELILSEVASMSLLVLALGTLYQWCVAVGGRSGRGVFLSITLLLTVPAHVAGRYWQLPLLEATSPSAHFQQWLSEGAPLAVAPLLLTFGTVLVLSRLLVHRYISRAGAVVRRKLEIMGVTRAIA